MVRLRFPRLGPDPDACPVLDRVAKGLNGTRVDFVLAVFQLFVLRHRPFAAVDDVDDEVVLPLLVVWPDGRTNTRAKVPLVTLTVATTVREAMEATRSALKASPSVSLASLGEAFRTGSAHGSKAPPSPVRSPPPPPPPARRRRRPPAPELVPPFPRCLAHQVVFTRPGDTERDPITERMASLQFSAVHLRILPAAEGLPGAPQVKGAFDVELDFPRSQFLPATARRVANRFRVFLRATVQEPRVPAVRRAAGRTKSDR